MDKVLLVNQELLKFQGFGFLYKLNTKAPLGLLKNRGILVMPNNKSTSILTWV